MHELSELDKNITLFINGSHSLMWDYVIYTATQTLTWIPVGLILLYIVYRQGGMRCLLMVLGMILLGILISDQLSSSIVKPIVKRFRPTQDPQIMYLVDVVNNYRGGRYGFFSAHASNTFTVALFLTLLFRHRMAGCLLVSWSLLNSYTRVYLGVHYFGDVVVGTAIGAVVGWGLYRFFIGRMPDYKPGDIREGFTSSGFTQKSMYALSACILLNYCALFIISSFCS